MLVTYCSRGRNPTHCIIRCRAITIRPRDQERSCRNKARITRDMLIHDTDNRRRMTMTLNIPVEGTTNIDGKVEKKSSDVRERRDDDAPEITARSASPRIQQGCRAKDKEKRLRRIGGQPPRVLAYEF
ncbi:hypothetical protein BHE74_00040581 [Ensete ventricosum]|nr:hypothetical protein BHE74_00040581 [Ensete ventricosum]